MIEQLDAVERHAMDELAAIDGLDKLRTWRGDYLARSGPLAEISRGMGGLSAEERPRVGQRMNQVKQALQAAYDELEAHLTAAAQQTELEGDRVDVTLPGRPVAAGRLHPITQTIRQIERIFSQMGFVTWESREVELDEYNFGLLNFPPDHPARDMQDTFFVKAPAGERVVLRTHTSPGQIHAMRRFAPEPVRVLLPGKCYRNEQVTARAELQFTQFEFLAVGHNITMGDLKGTLQGMAEALYGAGMKARLRPGYFPFTEPSAELDVSCSNCKGAGCRICKYTGWLEIGGCGMVHPTVLRNGGYDPEKFSGFAGGFGYERIAINQYDIDDIRWFLSGDLRFLEQF